MTHPREEILVALDLETTGVDPKKDRVIEIGAVKFKGNEEIERFSTTVNPRMPIPQFVSNLTGISQSEVDMSPEWQQVCPELDTFIGGSRLVGHQVKFDVSFLRNGGIDVDAGSYDTLEMARVALPHGPEFGLERLSTRFGIWHDAPHRALSDAIATKDLFTLLLAEIERLPVEMLRRLAELTSSQVWSISGLARGLSESVRSVPPVTPLGAYGINEHALAERLAIDGLDSGIDVAEPEKIELGADFEQRVDAVFSEDGPLAQVFPNFETRDGQREMARAVAKSLANGTNAVVEAGTGIGKTLAYLIPAAMYATETGAQVVVSTNTINLQEQLLNKDFAVVRDVVRQVTGHHLVASQLKGRANYLCYRRWLDAIGQQQTDVANTRVLAQCLTWLNTTDTGDSAEIALSFDAWRFRQYSAEGCPPKRGRPSYPCKGPPCFMLKARSNANSADVVIVNHPLLIVDRINESNIVPNDAALIIDEAHHLQAVATDQLGFLIRESALMEDLNSIADPSGIMARLTNLVGASNSGEATPEVVRGWFETATQSARSARRHARVLFGALQEFTTEAVRKQGTREMRILGRTRIDPNWQTIVEHWANLAPELKRVTATIDQMLNTVGRDGDSDDATVINASVLLENLGECLSGLHGAIDEPDDNNVYWTQVDERRNLDVDVRGAPLDVSEVLGERLFSLGRPTVLTGATLSFRDDFSRFAENIGIGEHDALTLPSPFGFERAALVLVPEDIPAPNEPGYAEAVNQMLKAVCDSTDGRSLALFTSNSALNKAHQDLYQHLSGGDTQLLAQGRDGPAARVLRLLSESERAIALGSMAMWEGIDLEDASIKSLVMTRLPFPVPTDPIHASRSERMDNPFVDYMVPEAVLKFRQGFGRLIRSHTDRGVFVVLDRRILTMRYATEFQRSIPSCSVRRVSLNTLSDYVRRWHDYIDV